MISDANNGIGCPEIIPGGSTRYKPISDPRPSTYEAEVLNDPTKYGNFYVKGNFNSQTRGFCGSVYVGGNFETISEIVIWGDLYVEGDLSSTNKLVVHGNVTVKGDFRVESSVTIKGDFVMPNNTSFIINNLNGGYIGGKVWINASVSGTNASNLNFCSNTSATTPILYMRTLGYPDPNNSNKCLLNGREFNVSDCSNGSTCGNTIPAGTPASNGLKEASLLSYLGNQITTSPPYKIPDPIVLGFEGQWLQADICPALATYAVDEVIVNGVTFKDVVKVSKAQNKANEFVPKLNSCAANWNSDWVVLRIDWDQFYNQFENYVLDGNFIIIVVNRPGNSVIALPRTAQSANVLLYLMQGAETIESKKPSDGCPNSSSTPPLLSTDCYRNYFIYSAGNITKIVGELHLSGNLFMKDGAIVETMQDPRIEANEALFDALSNAGIIKDNVDKCAGTGLDDGSGGCSNSSSSGGSSSSNEPVDPISSTSTSDPSYVPAIPHLKVKLQSQYANEEDRGNDVPAEPAILIMPRIVYMSIDEINGVGISPVDELYKRFNVLYLNGAYKGSRASESVIKNQLTSCVTALTAIGASRCTVDLSNPNNCTSASGLCSNSFYINITPSVVSSASGSSSSSAAASSSSGGGSSSASSSSSVGGASSSSGGSITITAGSFENGTYIVNNTITCKGACLNNSNTCSIAGVGGSCGSSPGYNCEEIIFTAGTEIIISGGGLKIHDCWPP